MDPRRARRRILVIVGTIAIGLAGAVSAWHVTVGAVRQQATQDVALLGNLTAEALSTQNYDFVENLQKRWLLYRPDTVRIALLGKNNTVVLDAKRDRPARLFFTVERAVTYGYGQQGRIVLVRDIGSAVAKFAGILVAIGALIGLAGGAINLAFLWRKQY